MKQFKILLLLVVAFVLLIPASGCAAVAGPWRGQVIDAETKAPIEGAVVVAVWERSHFSVGGPVERFEDARETMTDKDGKFEIPTYEYNPIFRDKTRPLFTIFKPGYGYHAIIPEGEQWVVFLGKGATVELQKLNTKKERLDFLHSLENLNNAPKGKLPKFEELILIENRNLGINTGNLK